MFFQIQTSNGLAIYEQVVRQIKFAVADRSLRPGERVPSVRELAKHLTLNPNTVSRAYRQLQDEGVLEAVRGVGLQVTQAASKKCRDDRTALIRERLRVVLGEARQSGLTDEDVQRLVNLELKRKLQKPLSPDDEV